MIRIIWGVLILAIGGYIFYLGVSGFAKGTVGSRSSNVVRAVVALVGAGIAFVGIAMMVVR